MKRWSNEGPDGPHPMTPALRVEIRSEVNQARIRMVYGVVLALLGIGLTIWTHLEGSGRIAILGGALVLALWAFLSGYAKVVRVRRYLNKHGVPMDAVTGPHR
ncbi:hypothetical protein [Streptomyces sp. NPDC087525]|uniref:hypothetical protein n=1 Tax=Streptomyces sp. NPDC087525 TaxID=3365793 RepID=UPI0037FF9CF0